MPGEAGLGRLDLREQPALANMGADVEVPAFGAGIDRRVGKQHDLAGQRQFLICRVVLRMHDDRHRLLSGGCCQSGFGRGAMVDALIDPAAKQQALRVPGPAAELRRPLFA